MKGNKVENAANVVFETVGNVVQAAFLGLALLFVPLPPALLFGYAVYEVAIKMSGNFLYSLIVGSAMGIALESVGILASHTAIEQYTHKDNSKAAGATILLIGYIVLGILTTWLVDTPQDQKVLGTAAFLLSGLAYMAVALRSAANGENKAAAAIAGQDAKRQNAIEDAKVKAEIARIELESKAAEAKIAQELRAEKSKQAQQLELAKKRAEAKIGLNGKNGSTAISIAKSSVNSSNSSANSTAKSSVELASPKAIVVNTVERKANVECKLCGSSFGSKQALGAHKRFCKGAK